MGKEIRSPFLSCLFYGGVLFSQVPRELRLKACVPRFFTSSRKDALSRNKESFAEEPVSTSAGDYDVISFILSLAVFCNIGAIKETL